MGEGCVTDQILGQWHAEVAGIGGFLDDGKVETALKAVPANFAELGTAPHVALRL